MTIQISDQEKKLLDLVAKGEAVQGADPYSSLWPSTVDLMIPQYTLAQIDQYQTDRISAGFDSSAIGRYQFIRGTLREVVGQSGLAGTTRFSPDVQDYLIIVRLKKLRKLDSWKSGQLSDKDFQLELAREFASVPVPYDTQGNTMFVRKGQSYYSGDGLNSSGHNADVFSYNLADIRNGGPGNLSTVDIENGSAAYQPTGTSPKTQAEIAAGGGQRVSGGSTAFQPLPNSSLPAVGDPYVYKLINALDNRYDFRTGEKVRDLLINGVNPVANSGTLPNNGRPPLGDVGGQPLTVEQLNDAVANRVAQVGDIVTGAKTINTPAGPKTVTQQYKVVETPAGPKLSNYTIPTETAATSASVTAPSVQTVNKPSRVFISPSDAVRK
jgi:hypothetical protein